jgi:hypothetical protein
MQKSHGGFRPGSGRKPMMQGDTCNFTLRIYEQERDVLRQLGGVKFIRQAILNNGKAIKMEYKVEIVEHENGDDNISYDYLIIRDDGVMQIYQWHEIHYCGKFAAGIWCVVPGEPDAFNLSQYDIQNIISRAI